MESILISWLLEKAELVIETPPRSQILQRQLPIEWTQSRFCELPVSSLAARKNSPWCGRERNANAMPTEEERRTICISEKERHQIAIWL